MYLEKLKRNLILSEIKLKSDKRGRAHIMPQVKILYASDFHGSTVVFKKFINAGLIYGVDYLIYGGDLTGKAIIPIVEVERGMFKFELMGKKYNILENELSSHIERIENIGYYPLLVRKGEESVLEDDKYMSAQFTHLMSERIKKWLFFAKEKLRSSKVKLFLQLGNDDEPDLVNTIRACEDERIIYAEERIVQLEQNYELVSLGYTNITPWKCPRDIDEEIIESKLDKLFSNVKNPNLTVLNTHCPPYDTNIDLAPKLDKDLRPIIASGGVVMEHVGCISVRRIIEKYQPLVGLHGHIHESRGIDKIKRTLVLNPGSDYNVGVLRAAYVVLERDKVKSYLLISG